jgi:tetratricopeptide (TPR) repeat protein
MAGFKGGFRDPGIFICMATEYSVMQKLLRLEALMVLFFLCSVPGCISTAHDPEGWNNAGETDHAMGRYGEAVASFDRAIALDPGYGEAWRNRGLSLSQLHRYNEAEVSYQRALEIDPNDIEAYYERALSRNASGNTTSALESVDQAVAIVPTDHDTAVLLAQSWVLRGDILTTLNREIEANGSYRRANEIMMTTI